MQNQIVAVVVDEETILLDGHMLIGKDELANAFKSALEGDPNFILLIGSKPTEHYKGIGTVIYASQRVGVPLENIRWTLDDGDVVTFDELRTRSQMSSL
jgi:hypothetical protein